MNHRLVKPLLLALLAGLAVTAAQAQYKVVGPDGRITYTDRPATASGSKIEPMRSTAPAPAGAGLPYALRTVAERYPVTLYSAANCSACESGRSLLRERGVPYVEKSVATEADLNALKRLESSGEVPVLRIGNQQLRGFSQAEWRGYLDAAGYPKQSLLPAGYAGWDATPLTPRETPTSRQANTPPPVADLDAALPPALESAPNGIRF